MAVPSAPYCDSVSVAILVSQLLKGNTDFSTETQPTKRVVNTFITWICAEIDMAFAQLGFYVPYQEISGETWPDSQTNILRMMSSFGVAGTIVGPASKPAPAMGRDGGGSENAYTTTYKNFLSAISTNAAGFRMNYRVGSKAEQFCRTPAGPTTDYLEGYLDPTLFQTVEEYTDMIVGIRTDYGIDMGWQLWDHLRTKRSSLLA